MPRDPRLEQCKQDKHIATIACVDAQEYSGGLEIQTVCVVCQALLSYTVGPGDWCAVHDNDAMCETCEEAPPYCDCPCP